MFSKCPNCGANINNSFKCDYCNSFHFNKVSPNDEPEIIELAEMLAHKSLSRPSDVECALFVLNSCKRLDRKAKLRVMAILTAKGYDYK